MYRYVVVPFQDSTDGTKLLRFAGSYARAIGAGLNVSLPPGFDRTGRFQIEEMRIQDLLAELVLDGLRLDSIVTARPFAPLVQASDEILIASAHPDRKDLTVLQPFDETSLDVDEDRVMFIPFGSGQSGLVAALKGLPLAKLLGLKVVFYHSTWMNPEMTLSMEPFYHMCKEALNVMADLRKMAEAAGIAHRFLIDFASDVVEGIILSAIRERATLIVTVRGDDVRTGSYAKRLRMGPVPLLTVGNREVV